MAALLKGLGEQTFECLQQPILRIIIADNEGSNQARQLCDQFSRSSDTPIEYVHEPRRGISHARNACLDRLRADCEFFAMIDDDEIPDPGWIEQLLLAQQRTGADVVQGRVVPILPDGVSDWIVKGRYFDYDWCPSESGEYPELEQARTSNVLVRHAAIQELGLCFDPQFALTGGEDIVFFQAVKAAGYRIVYAPTARVRDIISPDRARLSYLLRMWYRVGCNERFKHRYGGKPNPRIKRVIIRKWRASGCPTFGSGIASVMGNLLTGRISMNHLAPGIRLIARGLGQAAGLAGIRYEHYR